MSLNKLKSPSPRATLYSSSLLVVFAWLFFDFAIRDPSTILFALIALGSDFLVRNVTSGAFTDRYWFVVVVVQCFLVFSFYFFPAIFLKWFGARHFQSNVISALIFIWLVFYLAALSFLFDLRLILRLL